MSTTERTTASSETEAGPEAPPAAPGTPKRVGRRGRRRRWRLRRIAAIVLVVVLVPVGWSYVGALTAPGSAPWTARTVEWISDHGGRGLVVRIERWWYSWHKPPVGGTPPGGLPRGAGVFRGGSGQLPATRHLPPHLPRPADVTPLASPHLKREGVWRATGRTVDGIPAMYTTSLRPDSVHTSLVAGVAWMDTKLLRAVLVAGTQEPGGSGWPWGAEVPLPRRTTLAATFNSGFKLSDSRGGYYSNGRSAAPLLNGEASLVIYEGGTATVAKWGRDATMGPNVASVRQNLSLIVDHGRPVPGLSQDSIAVWGATLGNQLLVWRSGVGVDRNGGLLYAAGPGMSVASLARVLAAAGAVRAMELDINTDWTSFNYYRPDPKSQLGVDPFKLLPDMARSPDRYLVPDERDFVAMFTRAHR
ncbi:MAG: phosphodiester glycosidase family protein [Actinomycetota bacterium]|nr:phosphodiester glycosidase family protein [Actinomycetota bacterium]